MREAPNAELLPIEPPDPKLVCIQPGGGTCMRLELAWGTLRRWYLRTFRGGYVARMERLRHGSPQGCPHPVLDPRDLKYYRNVCDCSWDVADDPFAWRDRLPVARVGLAELLLIGGGFVLLAALLGWLWWPFAIVPGGLAAAVLWFFRDPPRQIPPAPGLVVSPADGRIVAIDEIEDPFTGGPALMIGIFLSVFNVHLNRSPVAGRIVGQTYRPGQFLNALRPASARENEQLEVRLQQTEPPYRCFRVRQIAGAIARRIVCWAGPGTHLRRGEQFGMIKIGSRTELVLPRTAELQVAVRLGQKVRAGTTVLARYQDDRVESRESL